MDEGVTSSSTILAAIDVGTNAVRLKLARPHAGGLDTVHEERDAIRPGEGVFRTGVIGSEVAERLIGTLRRYGAICRRHRAVIRAVATSAVREARNGGEILKRVRREAGFELEQVSGREEARLICLGVLDGTAADVRSLVVDIGGGSTEVAIAHGESPRDLYTVALGSVRLTELFAASRTITARKLRVMREYAAEIAERGLPPRPGPRRAIGSSGTIRAVVAYAGEPGTGHATIAQLEHAVEELASFTLARRRQRFDPQRAEIVVAGAVVLEAVARRLGLASIAATERGLRDGLLIDLWRHRFRHMRDDELGEAALAVGRWFRFDEPHARHVARLALSIYDGLASLHGSNDRDRRYLEVAALLHDIGHALGYQRHHKHTAYLIENTDIPGLADRERMLVARIARYHRRSNPDASHVGMDGLSVAETRMVRRLATILRVADSLDRSHHQPVKKLRTRVRRDAFHILLERGGNADLEVWDAAHEAALFRRVFGRRLVVT
jgi:exopolyphosphatase/guanosine-5'-triphosphate,3'-diphosphate pyrophosphatase